MPHGGGHAGGGGGHHSGGGGGGHHHYGRSRRSRDGCDGEESPAAVLRGMISLLAVALIILIVPVTISYQSKGAPISLVLSPGDTRILSRSSTLCQGSTLSGGSALGTVNSSMYFLSNTPTLNAANSFVISSEAFVGSSGDYQFWSFHLYPGSKYLVSACLSLGYSVQYIVVKGTKNYNKWVKTPSSQSAYGNFVLYVLNSCSGYNMTANFNFTSEDDYYFIFYNSNPTPASVRVTFSFYRPEYSPQSGSIISNCTTTSFSSCSLDIPYNSDYIILLVTSPPSDGDWSANVDITSSCAARAWVYVVIEFSTVALLVLSALLVAACIFRDRIKRMCSGGMGMFQSRMPITPSPTAQVYTTTTVQTSTPASQVPSNEVFTTPTPPIGFIDAPVTGVLTAPPPPDYAYGVLAPPPPTDYKEPLAAYKDEPPPY